MKRSQIKLTCLKIDKRILFAVRRQMEQFMGNCCPYFPGSDQGVIAFYYSLLRQWHTIKVEVFLNGEVPSNNTKPTKKLANQLILKTNFVAFQCRQACWKYRDWQKWRQKPHYLLEQRKQRIVVKAGAQLQLRAVAYAVAVIERNCKCNII